jgi:nucleoside-diphosphate-sugar epimerase
LIERLVKEGRPVMATTTSAAPEGDNFESVQWINWNALEAEVPTVVWKEVDAVVHLAKPHDAIRGQGARERNFALSVAATHGLLRRAAASGVRRFVFCSTGYVLGAREAPSMETDRRFSPREPYGSCKACGELVNEMFRDELATATLRFFFPYGPGGDEHFVNRVARSVLEGREIRLDGTEGIRLNPVWIEDLVQGIMKAIDSAESGTFHLAGPETVSLRQLADIVGRISGREPLFRHSKGGNPDWHVGDMVLASRHFGYAPRTNVEAGLRRLIACGTEVVT